MKRLTKAQKAELAAQAELNAQAVETVETVETVEAETVAPVETVEALAPLEAETVEALASEQADEAAPVEAEPLAARAVRAQDALCDAIRNRIAHAANANFAKNMNAELKQLSGRNALIAIEKCIALEVDFFEIARCYAITEKSAHDYVAIYAAQKIRKAVFALACGMSSVFDGYTVAILKNLIKIENLSNRGSQRSLSRAIVFDKDEQENTIIRAFKDCAPSTASTQASSTRQMLRFMNVCNVVKNQKDDVMTFTESNAALKVQSIFEAYKA